MVCFILGVATGDGGSSKPIFTRLTSRSGNTVIEGNFTPSKGDTVTLTCTVDMFSRIEWVKDDEEVEGRFSNMSIQQLNRVKSQLTMLNVRINHTGYYSCNPNEPHVKAHIYVDGKIASVGYDSVFLWHNRL